MPAILPPPKRNPRSPTSTVPSAMSRPTMSRARGITDTVRLIWLPNASSAFDPFPQFVKDRWGETKLPDPHLGYLHLTATGGHPGADAGTRDSPLGVTRLPPTSRFTARSAIPPIRGMASVAGSFPAVRVASRHGPSRTTAARHRSRHCTSSRAKKSISSWTACRTKIMTVLRGACASARSNSPARRRASRSYGIRRTISGPARRG